jgi:pilus assembly protein CpaB
MMQKITRLAALLLVAVAVVLAVVAIGLGRHAARPATAPVAASSAAGSADAARQGFPVVVAAAPLAAGVPVTAAGLRLAQWPQAPAGAYADPAAVVGSIPRVDIPPGTPVLATLLAHDTAMALRPGERAMAVPVDEQAGAGNRIQPGDYVDVFLSLKTSPSAGYGKAPVDATQTRLLLSRLRVLAYGDENLPARPRAGAAAQPAADAAKKSASRSDDAPRAVPRTAVLAVPVQDADRLLLGVQNGKLSLALRRPDDAGQPDSALFPLPRTVLAARNGLSAEQRQQLDEPENRAFAGLDGEGLAGRAPAAPPVRSRRPVPAWHGVEVIRGSSDPESRANRSNSP